MVINSSKTKTMIFNKSRKFDFTPNLTVSPTNENIDVVESFKLLGVMIRSDLSWTDNTKYICSKGFARLWLLRRLKALGLTKDELLDVYMKQVRPVMELAVPAWQPGLSQLESNQLERIQKCALHIILGDDYTGYEAALEMTSCVSLEARRMQICEKFAVKTARSNKYSHWFVPNVRNAESRNIRHMTKYKPAITRTIRCEKSPIPFLTKILNS